jgi:hypothetical protein
MIGHLNSITVNLMKSVFALAASGLVFGLMLVSQARGQSYSIDWFTIDGGGGTSSGGPYSLSGTIGQADAGRLSGGNYTLDGGFWGGVVAVQVSGSPTLQIQAAGPNYTLSWSPSTPGFVLQVNSTLSPLTWTDAPTGTTNPAPVPGAPGNRFYRLRQP